MQEGLGITMENNSRENVVRNTLITQKKYRQAVVTIMSQYSLLYCDINLISHFL
jgi:hypothetical protein